MEIESTTGYLNAKDAAALDVELMQAPGFSLEQLMELAGLSVAEAVYYAYPPPPPSKYTATTTTTTSKSNNNIKGGVLIICGPGNNGGDGLVAARHLVHFGYENVTVVYPKQSKKKHFINLVQQCSDVDVAVCEDMPENWQDQYSVVVDAIFGFSFRGEPREPFKSILSEMIQFQEQVPIVSVDVPSGWDVDRGDIIAQSGLMPRVLVSLTTPKPSSRNFPGRHFVGGRFLPHRLAAKYGIRMPPYPGVSQVMEVSTAAGAAGSNTCVEIEGRVPVSSSTESSKDAKRRGASSTVVKKREDDDWRLEYAKFLAEKEAVVVGDDDLLSSAATAASLYGKHSQAIYLDPPPGADEDWAVQYDQYLREKYEEEQKKKESGKQ